jgi:hypothetical protein
MNSAGNNSPSAVIGSWYMPSSFVMLSQMVGSSVIAWSTTLAPYPAFSGFLTVGNFPSSGFDDNSTDMGDTCRNFKEGNQTLVEMETSRNNSLRRNLEPITCKRSGNCKGCVKANDHSKVCYNYQEKTGEPEKEDKIDEDNVRIDGMVDSLK